MCQIIFTWMYSRLFVQVPFSGHKRGSGKSHLTSIATLASLLSLAEGNAVLFAPLDGHLPKFDLLEPIPSVPQVIFGK